MQGGRWVPSGGQQRMAGWLVFLCFWNLSTMVSCDRAPREPSGRAPSTAPSAETTEDTGVTEDAESKTGDGGEEQPDSDVEAEACVVPLLDPPPPAVAPVDDCPEDPNGRPEMPFGTVTFPETPDAPELRVELALTSADQTHGLMFRPVLGDQEGMLFSWTNEQTRSFWMRNTCLALDMLFVQSDGTVSKILQNVPPMNRIPRRSDPCAVAHVLEVRAGWTKAYGVKPGQKMLVSGPEN